ncbi:hypothetical protein BABINDRAFT_162716 [Babjeviella inositovora NRRL Y-12698]|uniref:Purine-cytosine permease n=1 Tax=Babjeviella inositovora NRRL Y-12698 TaxID=984486 RepID=A0A1E3QLE7_9ASCO|nr:uncharacterized protein BABINDRAFT_162716 [Babjeviella inositovora NRRL Y-12698]ODQ78511.1 hypothetical protein BABINDRAFT_162716 [Babjeviella inositovora NRRL Y-12698]
MSDLEKQESNLEKKESNLEREVRTNSDTDVEDIAETKNTKLNILDQLGYMLKAETRGVERVPDSERTSASIYEVASMWFSANLVIATFALGALAGGVFKLNFWTAVLANIFFTILGALPVALFSVFGPKFGLRQMILSRYLAGNYGSRIFAFLNCISGIGWGAVNTMVSAQLLHIVNNGALPPWAGCLIIILLTITVTFFGYKVIHIYEKYSWIPNAFCFVVIIARMKMSGEFRYGEWASGPTVAGAVLSYGGAIFGSTTGWSAFAADYTVYMPKTTNSYKVFFAVFVGLVTPIVFCLTLGNACSMGLHNERWAQLYLENSVGGLVYAVLVEDSLHGFGQFCCVLLALSTVANNIPNMYSMSLSAQAVWSKFHKLPRIFWSIFGNAATLAICIPAYYSFATVMSNFMNLVAYYLAIYESVTLSEHFIYRRTFSAYNIEDHDDFSKLPVGIAGVFGFCCGVTGAVLGMNQAYYQGVVAKMIGENGGDIGFELAAGFGCIGYNLVRPLEKKYFGR